MIVELTEDEAEVLAQMCEVGVEQFSSAISIAGPMVIPDDLVTMKFLRNRLQVVLNKIKPCDEAAQHSLTGE